VVGALLLKRASDLGADVWRTTRIINYMTRSLRRCGCLAALFRHVTVVAAPVGVLFFPARSSLCSR
jgi:hypothetical protein